MHPFEGWRFDYENELLKRKRLKKDSVSVLTEKKSRDSGFETLVMSTVGV